MLARQIAALRYSEDDELPTKTLQNVTDKTPVDITQNSQEGDSCKSIESLKEIGANIIYDEVVALQSITARELSKEKKTINTLTDKVVAMIPMAYEAKDVKALVMAYESLIALKRKIALLPFGSVNPNVQAAKENSSKHLHLHNHGLKDFVPGQGT